MKKLLVCLFVFIIVVTAGIYIAGQLTDGGFKPAVVGKNSAEKKVILSPLVSLPKIIERDYTLGKGLNDLNVSHLPKNRTVVIYQPGNTDFQNSVTVIQHIKESLGFRDVEISAVVWIDWSGKLTINDFNGTGLWKTPVSDFNCGTGYSLVGYSNMTRAVWYVHELFEEDLSYKLVESKDLYLITAPGEIMGGNNDDPNSIFQAMKNIMNGGIRVHSIRATELKLRPKATPLQTAPIQKI